MRQIKFRAKAIVNQKWNDIKVGDFVYGSFIQSGVDAPCIIFGDGEQIEIDLEALGQFTGLKDVNGVDIYEGDELSSYHFTDGDGDHFISHMVQWSEKFNGWFALSKGSQDPDNGSLQLWVYMSAGNKHNAKVIGNIHDK